MKVIVWIVFLFHVYGAFFCDVVNIDWYTNHSNLKAKNLAIFSCYISMQTLQCNNEIWEQQPKQQETSKENTYLNVTWIDVKFLWCFCKIWWFCYVLMHTNARWRMERMTFIWNDRIPVRWTTGNNMICAHITCVYNFCGPIWLVLIDLFWFFYMNSRRIWCFSFCCPISLLQCKNPSWVCLPYNTQTHTHIYIYICIHIETSHITIHQSHSMALVGAQLLIVSFPFFASVHSFSFSAKISYRWCFLKCGWCRRSHGMPSSYHVHHWRI